MFDPPDGRPLGQILLPVPTAGSKGVLVFPTLDGQVVRADRRGREGQGRLEGSPSRARGDNGEGRADVSAARERQARGLLRRAAARRARRNYLIARSQACDRLVNVAAIRSTGLTASLAIGEHVAGLVAALGVHLAPQRPLEPAEPPVREWPWWRRVAEHRGAGMTHGTA